MCYKPINRKTSSIAIDTCERIILPNQQVIELEEYSPPTNGREGMLRLDFNENTTGCSPKVVQALKTIDANKLSVYPEYGAFLSKLSKFQKVRVEELVLTNGTDEAINIILNAFVESGDEVIIPTPTFAMFKFFATIAGAKTRQVLYNKDLSFPFELVMSAISEKTKIVVLVNPNNPTGTVIPEEQIVKIVEKAKENGAIVLIDEAYYEFYGKTSLWLIGKYNNLFITRTFSKAYGLAGLRIGYIMGDERIIASIKKSISPYSVNALATICASAALDDFEFVEEYVKEVINNRVKVAGEIEKLGVKTCPSSANFVLCYFGEKCQAVCAGLKKKGILVRNRTNDPLLKGCVRIGVGTKEQNEQLMLALKEVLIEIEKKVIE